MAKYKVISTDGHLEVPPEVWHKYLPAKFVEGAPHTVRLDDGRDVIRMGEHEHRIGMSTRGAMDDDEFVPANLDHFTYPDGSARAGTGTAAQRLHEQDIDDVDAEVLFRPVSFPRLKKELLPQDADLYLAVVRAYNTWLGEEYCPVAPDRLIGLGFLPETSLEDAILEAKRCKDMGLHGMSMGSWPNGSGYYEPGDEQYFAEMADMDMLLAAHSNFGASSPKPDNTRPEEGGGKQAFLAHRAPGPAFAYSQLILNGIFDKVPQGQIYFGETYISWMPSAFNRMDEHYLRRSYYYDVRLKKLPSEYIRDHFSFSFIHERQAMPLRYYIGIDSMMWGSDLPHNVNTFPHSKASLDEMFYGISEDEKHQVLVANPCKWFRLDPDAELTPTPSM